MEHYSVTTSSERETITFGKHLAASIKPPMVFSLSGILGSGKTTLTKGIVQGLCRKKKVSVTSPTFVLINQYEGRFPIYHIDCYRLDAAGDFEDIGIDECLYSKGIAIVEWGEKIARLLPDDCVWIRITCDDEHTRTMRLSSKKTTFLRSLQRGLHG